MSDFCPEYKVVRMRLNKGLPLMKTLNKGEGEGSLLCQ